VTDWLILQHVPHEGPEMIANWLRGNEQEFEIQELWHEQLRLVKDYKGLIVMGGPMSANDEHKYDFITPELKAIDSFVQQQKPILGICLGAQLLAKALGAKVFRGPQKEIGWYPVHLAAYGQNDPVLTDQEHEKWVFHWHGETFDLPEGAKLLASSELYQNQAFVFNNRAYGLQFHVEMTEQLIGEWLRINKDEVNALGATKAEEIKKDTLKYLSSMQEYGKNILRKFIAL